ncbi:MAG: hypothetical protein ABIN80_21215 [Dyadobacter sp.]|uniref:hypothetical protein n=1 Tax=Dyadobacter sp. TaxID=1914288 RepID=UPI003265C6F0
MSVAAVFILFDLLGGEEGIKLPIYYHERTHPHSAIRIIAIGASFLEILKQQYGIDELSVDNVLRRTFRILAEILQQSRFIEKFPEHLKDEEKNINEYLGVLLGERNKYPWLAGNQIDALFRARESQDFRSKH